MSASAVSEPDRPPDRFHEGDPTLAQYSEISRSAVLALLLGLASALMLVSPILVLVPLAAVAAAVVGLRGIAASSGQLTGRWPAILGLCLATLFLGWGFSREWSRQTHIRTSALQFAEHWLQLVRSGKLQQADQLMRAPPERLSSPAAMADFYKSDTEAGKNLGALFAREPLTSFTAMGPTGSYRLKALIIQRRRGSSDEVVFQYAYGEGLGTADERVMWLYVMRSKDLGSHPSWRIDRVDHLPPPEGF